MGGFTTRNTNSVSGGAGVLDGSGQAYPPGMIWTASFGATSTVNFNYFYQYITPITIPVRMKWKSIHFRRLVGAGKVMFVVFDAAGNRLFDTLVDESATVEVRELLMPADFVFEPGAYFVGAYTDTANVVKGGAFYGLGPSLGSQNVHHHFSNWKPLSAFTPTVMSLRGDTISRYAASQTELPAVIDVNDGSFSPGYSFMEFQPELGELT